MKNSKFRKSGKSSLQGQRAYSPERQLVQLFGKRGFGVLCYGWKRDSSRRRRISIIRRFPRLCHHTATTTILHGLFPVSLVPPEKFSGATGDFLRHCCRFSPAAPEIFSQAAGEFWEKRISPWSAPWSAGSSISRPSVTDACSSQNTLRVVLVCRFQPGESTTMRTFFVEESSDKRLSFCKTRLTFSNR